MTPRTVNVVCARTSVKVGCVPAVREVTHGFDYSADSLMVRYFWRCSFCGARVKVVA